MKKAFTVFMGAAIVAIPAVLAHRALMSVLEPEQLEAPAPVATAVEAEFAQLNSPLFAQGGELQSVNDRVKNAAPRRTSLPTSISALAGNAVITYSTLTTSSYDGGNYVVIVPIEGCDSIEIQNFWNGGKVHAGVDITTGTVTIPCQYITTDTTVGDMYISIITQAGKADKTTQITGTVDGDGNFNFASDWWAIFGVSGTYKDKYVAAYTGTAIVPANATMEYTYGDNTYSYPVRVDQTGKNVLEVTNLLGRGFTVTIDLNRDRSAKIDSQIAFKNSTGDWYTIQCVSFNDAGNLTSYSSQITIPAADAADNRTLAWTDWSLLCSTGTSYLGRLTTGKLTTTFDIEYPTLSVTSFKGSGTEEDPYQLSTLDDMILLSDMVNNASETVLGYIGNYTVYSAYEGQYFKVMNDIDMGNYKFDPIGHDLYHRFAGTFDGGGHTLSNLTIDGGSQYYSALFGVTTDKSSFKNIVFDNPNVKATSKYTAVLASSCYGPVDNVTVNNPTVKNESGYVAAGVVGIALAPVTNCRVYGGTVGGAGYVGGIAGEAQSTLSNCGVEDATITGWGESLPVGGVVGNFVYGDANNLWFKGDVTYSNGLNMTLGGIAGMVGGANISNSFAVGTVRGYSSDTKIGGAVGVLKGNLKNVYSAGRVHCPSKKAGGLIGEIGYYNSTADDNSTVTVQSTVTNCYTATSVYAETYQYDYSECREVIGGLSSTTADPTLQNVYFDKQMTNFKSTRFGASGIDLTSASGPAGFDAADWVFAEGCFPRIKGMEDLEAAKFSASAINMLANDNFKKLSNNATLKLLGDNTKTLVKKGNTLGTEGYYLNVTDNALAIGTDFGCDTVYMVNGNTKIYHFVNVAPITFAGQGSEEDPFLIQTKSDLIELAAATTDKWQTFPDTYFKMTNDIDLELDKSFKGLCSDASTAASSIAFQGVFDGSGYTIHRMTFPDKLVWSTEPTETSWGTLNVTSCTSKAGFVGRLGASGVVRNLNIAADCVITNFYSQVGSIVGQNQGTVDNCRNYADVSGISCWVGGIVGQNDKGSSVTNCYNAGNVSSGYMMAGGITGTTSGTVSGCVNTGDISVYQMATNYSNRLYNAGGITGGMSSTTVSDCVNFGSVYAKASNAGGISGSIASGNTISGCVSVGTVMTDDPSLLGALGGASGSTTSTNCYYDKQIVALKANGNSAADGMNGVETAELTSGKALEGLSAEDWDFTAGIYPVLAKYASEPKVDAARRVIVSIPSGSDASDLRVDATLSDNATWSLKLGTTYSIDGKTLKSPASVNAVVNDTIVSVNNAGVTKLIPITANPVLSLEGEGTEASPYLVKSTDDWATLCNFVSSTSNSLVGKYVRVTADLDFSEMENANVPRLGADGVTNFSGAIDFDNHTVKVALTSIANNSCALIGTLDESSSVKNLVIEGTVTGTKTYAAPLADKLAGKLENVTGNVAVTSTASYAGGIIGYIQAGAVLTNVVNKGTVSTSTTYAGGISGYSQRATFTDCGNEGTITNTGSYTKNTQVYLAGLVAQCLASDFVRCYNRGEICPTTTAWATVVGGLVAIAPGTAADPLYTFDSCWNEAAITGAGRVAGLVASVGLTSTTCKANIQMTNCYNTGDISSMSTSAISSYPTAGIISDYPANSTFTNCYNTGTVYSNKNVYAAGIAAYSLGTFAEGASTTFDGCYNTGNIIGMGGQAAGVVAYSARYVKYVNCHNSGDIEATNMAGGIVSALGAAGATIDNCYNTGNITISGNRAGGLVAWGTTAGTYVKNSWSSGDVVSTSTVKSTATTAGYGIAGLSGTSGAEFTNCYATGKVQGTSQCGGLVGITSKGNTKFTNCYFAGKIVCDADTCGNLIGNNIANGKVWNENNSITNCYYVSENTCDVNPEVGTAVTRAELCKLAIDGFTSIDDYTKPVVAGYEAHDAAVLDAAEPIFADGNTADNVTTNFKVGAPGVVTWTSDCSSLTFSGNDATFSDSFDGKIILTAKAGEGSKTYELTVKAMTSVDDLATETDVLSRRWFTTAGVEVAQPADKDGRVYIVLTTKTNGTTTAAKVLNK